MSHLRLLARRRGGLGAAGSGGGGGVSFEDEPHKRAGSTGSGGAPEGGSFRTLTENKSPMRHHIQETEADDDTSSSDDELNTRRTPIRAGGVGAAARRAPGTPADDATSREVAGAKIHRLVRMNTTKKKALRPLHKPPCTYLYLPALPLLLPRN